MRVLVAQSCPTLCDPMDCSSLGSAVHGILQARMLEQVTTEPLGVASACTPVISPMKCLCLVMGPFVVHGDMEKLFRIQAYAC